MATVFIFPRQLIIISRRILLIQIRITAYILLEHARPILLNIIICYVIQRLRFITITMEILIFIIITGILLTVH